MISKENDWASRGYLKQEKSLNDYALTHAEKLQMLKSNIAVERTLAARLLSIAKEPVSIEWIQALKIEKKLYCKMELCKALISHKESSVKFLIAALGEIGSNQYSSVPEKEFGKDNYPLPHDIASRTLAYIGKFALPELGNVLESSNERKISEAIDAVGYICYYDPHPQLLEKLKTCYARNRHSDLIGWKIVRAMSVFSESVPFLSEQKKDCKNKRIIKEIDRSLRLIEKRKK
jgi:hypothetical protein